MLLRQLSHLQVFKASFKKFISKQFFLYLNKKKLIALTSWVNDIQYSV